MRGAEPFFLPGGKHGILLIHGFTGSPAEMILLGEYLNNIDYTVLAVRLCGHGTEPRDMAHMTWHDWYDSACDGYYLLRGCCSDVCVAGLSMGGLLALLLGLNFPVKKIISLSTPVFISSKTDVENLPPREAAKNIYTLKARRHLFSVPPCCNISYKKMPLICVHELIDCIRYLKENINKITVPVLVVQSSNDHTVDNKSGRYIYDKIKSTNKYILQLEKSGHLVILDIERDIVFARIKSFLSDDSE